MALNGSGSYTPPSASFPAVASTLIESAKYNAVINDLATAMSTAIFKDGQQTVTANIPFGGYKLTGVGAATVRTDAATLATIQDGTGVYAATVGGTADVITLTPSPAITAYAAGQTFRFIASGANTTNVTVNISGLGAKAVTKNGTTALVAGDIPASDMVEITYDGTRFILLGASIEAVMTTQGDMIRFGSGVERFAIGAANTMIYSDATDPLYGYWADVGLVTNPAIPINLALSVTLSTNDIVVALKGQDGTDPSATNPVWIPFRSATATSGVYTWDKQTGAESVTIPSTATLGATASEQIRFYIYALRNGSNDVELAVARQALWSGDTVQTTTAIDATADSTTVLYSTSARTSKPITLIGVVEATSTSTPGQWTSVDLVSIWKPGMRKTGDVVQQATGTYATGATTTATFPQDDTIPQLSEGAQINSALDVTITPTSAINILEISVVVPFGDNGTANSTSIALFQDSTANALRAVKENSDIGDEAIVAHLFHRMTAGTTSATTLKVRIGGEGSTITINGAAGSRNFGGVAYCEQVITERYA